MGGGKATERGRVKSNQSGSYVSSDVNRTNAECLLLAICAFKSNPGEFNSGPRTPLWASKGLLFAGRDLFDTGEAIL